MRSGFEVGQTRPAMKQAGLLRTLDDRQEPDAGSVRRERDDGADGEALFDLGEACQDDLGLSLWPMRAPPKEDEAGTGMSAESAQLTEVGVG